MGAGSLIRGAIEVAEPKLVSGWIYAAQPSLRGALVLAFSGPRVVGSGRVDIYRKDLKEAGLGDGYCGFHFPIELKRGELAASIVVKLADSDVALLQAGYKVSR